MNIIRVKLAALHRAMDHYGWTDLILNHISARIKDEHQEYYLMNPFGLLYSEITASSLVKVDKNGELLEQSKYDSNPAGFIIHSAIYESRPDLNCIIHTHTPNGIAISSIEGGLECMDQMGFMFHRGISYHDFEGIAINTEEKKKISRDFGNNNCMILRNHGLIATGKTIDEAFWNYYYLELACDIQIKAMSTGKPINEVDTNIKELTLEQHNKYNKMGGKTRDNYPSNSELAFNSIMRMLDKKDLSYRL